MKDLYTDEWCLLPRRVMVPSTSLSPKRTKLVRTQRKFDMKRAQQGWSCLMSKRNGKDGPVQSRKHSDKWHRRIAWLLLLIQQPDGNTLKSVGGECFTSRRVLRSCLPRGPAESPWKVQQGPCISIFRKTSSNSNLQALPASVRDGGELRL